MNLSFLTTIISCILITTIVGVKTYITITYIMNGFYLLIIGIVTIPILILFLLFPVVFTVSNIALLFVPNSYWKTDSMYYIHDLNDIPVESLPFLTIQIPVYDEDFKKVLRHTLRDCVIARNHYIEMGGKCNIIVNDDGIFKFLNDRLNNLDSNTEVNNRVKYYKKYNINFTARKYQDRVGKFKKASNMNYCNNILTQSSPLRSTNRLKSPVTINMEDFEFPSHFSIQYNNGISTPSHKPDIFRDITVDKAKRHMYYGDISIGDYILLVDSDTKIPWSILPSIVRVFEKDPTIGYTQHFTVPLESSYQNFFSRMISFYTVNLYHVIFRVCTRNGDISPLIGHNITLRKSALEKISGDNDGNFWNENRVSEDFDLCLKMYQNGYKGIYVCDEQRSFGEGVSLSYKDEMVKYSKFAYGASEILFNPVKDWCCKGMLTKSFKEFMKASNVPFSSKVGIIGYLMTYFSISSAVFFTPIVAVLSCFVAHWELIMFDPLYAYIFLFCIYGILNPIVNYKLKRQFPIIKGHEPSVCTEFYCGVFFCIFYCSVSFPLFLGVIAQLFNINISWGSTVKSLSDKSCFKTFLSVFVLEKLQFVFSLCILAFTILFRLYFNLSVIMLIPLLSLSVGHFIVPFVLNPSLYFCTKEFEFDVSDTPEI